MMGNFINSERLRPYVRLLLRAVLLLLIIIFAITALPRLISLFSPLIIAFIIAYLINPAVGFLQKKFGVPRQLSSIIIVVVIFLGLIIAIMWGIGSVIGQTAQLARNIQYIWDSISYNIEYQSQNLRWLLDYLPGDTETVLADTIDSILLWAQSTMKAFADYILTNSMNITSTITNAILAAVVFIMASYFITAEYPRISELLERISGSPSHKSMGIIKTASKSAFGGYIRAQLLLALLAFVIMFAALFIYGQRYSLLIAFLLGIVDLLPIIGTIAILVPWGIICIVGGSVGKGVFLLILGVSFFLLRKLVEPKIVGSQTGLTPLLALTSIYVGMRIGGIVGAIITPIILMVIISIVKAGFFDTTVKDIKTVAADIKNFFWNE